MKTNKNNNVDDTKKIRTEIQNQTQIKIDY